jgi:hypothetical protein
VHVFAERFRRFRRFDAHAERRVAGEERFLLG